MAEKSTTVDLANLLLNVTQSSKLSGLENEINNVSRVQNDILRATDDIKRASTQLANLQKQNIEIQKQSLLQLEIQSRIQLQNALNKERQNELKNAIFAVRSSIVKALSNNKNIVKLVYLELIQKDLTANDINPKHFEEISDKEYAVGILTKLSTSKEAVLKNMTEAELRDLDIIRYDKPKLDINKLELSEVGIINNFKDREIKRIKYAQKKLQKKIFWTRIKWSNLGSGTKSIIILLIIFSVGRQFNYPVLEFFALIISVFLVIAALVIYLSNLIAGSKKKSSLTKKLKEIHQYQSDLEILTQKFDNVDNEVKRLFGMEKEIPKVELKVSEVLSRYPELDFIL